MQTQQLTEQLKTLRLRGMASALEESLTALSQKKLAPTTWLGQLLQALKWPTTGPLPTNTSCALRKASPCRATSTASTSKNLR